MSAESDDLTRNQVRETISGLQRPIFDRAEVLALLCAPLSALQLLPPIYHRFNTKPYSNPSESKVLKSIPALQLALLETVVSAWFDTLKEHSLESILFQYFCPDVFFSASEAAGYIAVSAYSSLTSLPINDFSLDALARLSRLYTIDRLHLIIFSKPTVIPTLTKQTVWEDLVRSVLSTPTKIANARGLDDIPEELSSQRFFSRLCSRIEELVASFTSIPNLERKSSLQLLVTRMVNVGLFPLSSPSKLTATQTSFFAVTLSTIRSRLETLSEEHRTVYVDVWNDLWTSLPLTLFSTVLGSLFANLAEFSDGFDESQESRGLVKREARLVSGLVGTLEDPEDEKWLTITSVLLNRKWDIAIARILVTWCVISDECAIPPRAVETLLSRTADIWTSLEYVKHTLLSQHQYTSTILLLSVSSFPENAEPLQVLAYSPAFITAINHYISHLDPAVRRCGLLAAEIVAQRTGKSLSFGQWEGAGQGQEWARKIRSLIRMRDADAAEAAFDVIRIEREEVLSTKQTVEAPKKHPPVQVVNSGYDSDDSLVGYASSPASSRSPSPTPSELEELEKDPTLNVGQKKVQKPVYLADLGNMLRGSAKPDDAEQVDRLEVALNCAEEIIRRKRDYGLELEENAVNLVYALVGLQNNYELDGFDEKRQGAVTALVVCCPKKAAPSIIDEYFKNQYSTSQRFVMLNALALGARELASLPVPPPNIDTKKLAFPSKQLPPALHKKLISYEKDNQTGQVQRLLDDISRAAIESDKASTDEKIPEIARERQLRIKKPNRVTEVVSNAKLRQNQASRSTTFTDLAAEYFLGPLIGNFWLFLRDEQTREERSAHRAYAYRAAGTGLILSPFVLAHFLGTIGVLMHAARYSPAYLAVLVPDALELTVTLGTRPMSSSEEEKDKEAAVLTAALELAIIVLDASLDLDGGRSLGLEHPSLLLGVGEWADHVLEALEKGVRVPGEGGAQELRLRRSAAGVVLKVDTLSSRWRQSMITM